MSDPVDIANAALEAHLAYDTYARTPGRLENDYVEFLTGSAKGAASTFGTTDAAEIIRKLGYTPEAVDYYAESERTAIDTARTVAVAADMTQVAKMNGGIWWEERDQSDLHSHLYSGKPVPEGVRYGPKYLLQPGHTYTPAEAETLLRMYEVDWGTLGFEADAPDAPALPVLTREMLPFTEPGFVWFEETLPYPDFDLSVIDAHGVEGLGTLPVRAIAWREVPHVNIGVDPVTGDEVTGPGLALFMYAQPGGTGPLVKIDFTGWGFNAAYGIDRTWKAQGANANSARAEAVDPIGAHFVNPHIAMVRILLTSLWGIMRSSIELTRPARHVRRRAERSSSTFPEYGDVQVITLRTFIGRNSKPPKPSEEGTREWTHRWIVRGHWAWRACKPENADEGEHARKRVYIDPYVKGPEDRPLIIKDKLYAVVR